MYLKGSNDCSPKMEVASVADAAGGNVESLEEHEGRLAHFGLNCKGGLQKFTVCIWHSECWIAGNEALLEAEILNTRDTPHPWLIACDATMGPGVFCEMKMVQ